MKNALPGRPLAGLKGSFKGFAEIKVLDFSKLLPGPYATQLLHDLGAKVTRVELPHFTDITREIPPKIEGVGFAYWMVNQGKKTLALDFRKPEGLKRLYGIIKKIDVLVEGFRPGLMERIGLGFRRLRRLNARLVYCSISGYDPEGPEARKAGHDLNFQAASGFLGLGNSEGRVAFPAVQVADIAGSHSAVIGILAALRERDVTGRGRHVRISLTDALRSWLMLPLGHLRATGREPKLGGQWWNGSHPFYRLYKTKDGRWLAVAALEKGFSYALLDALGLRRLKDLVADLTAEHSAGLRRSLGRVFASATLAQWERRLAGKDVCVTPVRALAQAALPGARR